MSLLNRTLAMLRGRAPHTRRPRYRGQSLVETALCLPIWCTLVFGLIDFSRLIYYMNMASQVSAMAARQITLSEYSGLYGSSASDCTAWQAGKQATMGLTISIDPKSIAGDSDPRLSTNNYTSPTAGQAYLYLYPAVAQSATSCTGGASTKRQSGPVVAQVTINFQPWTPLIDNLFPSIPLTFSTTYQTEYNGS